MGRQILLTTGVASTALGVVALSWPRETPRVVGVLFGVYLLVIGVFQLAAAFGTHVPGHLPAARRHGDSRRRLRPGHAGARGDAVLRNHRHDGGHRADRLAVHLDRRSHAGRGHHGHSPRHV
ncbi:DUF308 domain-containing protein [Kitasatospora sp. NPDC093679]|uniref:DUF308 domain-containing protein n=1 Tax=Kitasatospora sp. NPDC093679 TaxID=3154983 RepID=UPI003418EDE4